MEQNNSLIQGSTEWLMCRLGKVTASRIADLTSKTKTGYSASRANYAAQLLVERLTGQCQESYTNAAMQWGSETEPQAKSAYSFMTDNPVIDIGFVDHPKIDMTGASPDGLVGDDGLIEIKCPNSSTHIENLLGDNVDGKYIKQMQWQMACTGKLWCDFVSFDPRMPVNLQLKIVRIERDNNFIAELEKEVILFLKEINDRLVKLRELE